MLVFFHIEYRERNRILIRITFYSINILFLPIFSPVMEVFDVCRILLQISCFQTYTSSGMTLLFSIVDEFFTVLYVTQSSTVSNIDLMYFSVTFFPPDFTCLYSSFAFFGAQICWEPKHFLKRSLLFDVTF